MAQAKRKAREPVDAWDSGELGREVQFAQRVEPSVEASLDDAVGLQMISIRLQKSLIEDLKFIATAHGIGYQPLVRDILSRFVVHEKKQIMSEVIERKKLEHELEQESAESMNSGSPKAKADKKVA